MYRKLPTGNRWCLWRPCFKGFVPKQLYPNHSKSVEMTCLNQTSSIADLFSNSPVSEGEELIPLESWEVPLTSLKGRMRARDSPAESCHGLYKLDRIAQVVAVPPRANSTTWKIHQLVINRFILQEVSWQSANVKVLLKLVLFCLIFGPKFSFLALTVQVWELMKDFPERLWVHPPPCVPCHVSCVQCNFFLASWQSELLEGLLSTRRTPATFIKVTKVSS